MIAQEDIRQMQLPEKLALLDAIWTDISSSPENIEVTQWHKDLLDARSEAYSKGEEEAIDWEVAKLQMGFSIT